MIYEIIIEAGLRGIFSRSGKENFIRPRPVNSAKAHRARLAACINFATGQLKGFEFFARFPDGDYLGMRRGIVEVSDGIVRPRNDLSVFYDYAAERSAGIFVHAFPRQPDGGTHEFFAGITHGSCF